MTVRDRNILEERYLKEKISEKKEKTLSRFVQETSLIKREKIEKKIQISTSNMQDH